MGTTRLILSQNLFTEPQPHHSSAGLPKRTCAVLLDNIRSAWNTGSIFRTADGFSYAHAYLCGITPTPDNESVKKTSLGAENSVSWTYHKDAVVLVQELKAQGWSITALEEYEKSTQLADAQNQNIKNNTLLIVGNETTGVDPHLLDLCDAIYHIPMHGEKKSFNSLLLRFFN
jgi:tRNA G18 (ribose-2'-O)-methylase SpoU